jgi:hypothetical protein
MSTGKGALSGAPNPKNIPEELRLHPQWVVWCFESRDGKETKVPYNAKASSVRASATDPETWASYELAVSTARMEDVDGIGFVFAEDDHFAGLDLDGCFDERGELHPDAARIVDTLDSYSERSPSRTGLHVIVRAHLGLNGHPRNRTDKVPWGGGIEVYSERRFFTVTGDRLEDTPDLVLDRQEELDDLLAELLPAPTRNGKPPPSLRMSVRSDSEVLARAFAARNGPKLMALYRGDRSGYGSDSQSDQALVSALAFWTGPDPGQLDRLFRGSGLMRDKWEREDYRDRTIAKALEGAEFFDWDDVPKPTRKLEELTDITVEKILDAAPDDASGELDELMKLLGQKKSAATRIVTLVKESDAVLFHDDEQIGYATIQVGEHVETHPVRSRGFKLWVRRLYWEKEQSAPPGQSLTDALGVLEGEALFAGPTVPVYYRVAGDAHAITIDLGDDAWRAVQVIRDGWQVLDHHPVRFARTGGMAPLPAPDHGGSLERLRPLVNVDDGDWRLLVGWLLAALRTGSPYPVLVLHGEQGSAKSTAAKVLRKLVDPNVVLLRAAPHAVDDLMVSSTKSWVVAFDNLSHLQPWLSDALCRLSTGGGLSKRQLYTDGDEVLLDAQRPVIINGIEELATRSDLLDRALLVECPLIPEAERRDEDEFWDVFDEHYPAVFGALLDALACALANIGTVQLDRMPRMADFAKWVTAAEPVLGWQPGTFIDAYTANRDESHELALEASIVGPPLLEVTGGGFEGTMTELLETLAGKVNEKVTRRKDWPKTGRGLSSHVKRLAPNLRALGVEIEFGREANTGRRIVTVAPGLPLSRVAG